MPENQLYALPLMDLVRQAARLMLTHMDVPHVVVALLWTSTLSSSFLTLLARKREILKVLKEKQKNMAINKAMS